MTTSAESRHGGREGGREGEIRKFLLLCVSVWCVGGGVGEGELLKNNRLANLDVSIDI